ncbi:unnamed protein product [Nezara viridula]|uniref:Indole-3-acetaldehyde oxidase n=1 Tax=Nezara viridula TaxID=85310 RepID=A0A9P0HFT0_NEZVI|nr:unnamed protein product [Nezara viridula]
MGAGNSHVQDDFVILPRNLGREVELTINGKKYKVSDNVPADTSLNTYIREYAHLKGTKFMCLEGGCGACIVEVKSAHPTTGKMVTQAVNSCLVPIFACHGWAVTTVEGLGSKKTGYDKVVKRLAAANGTQCGYCSPGMVMNMHSLLEENPNITMKEVENSFGGNICRCTGYRPILDAFKSLASDAPDKLVAKLSDIEDMICPNTGESCYTGSCNNSCSRSTTVSLPSPNVGLHFQLQDGASWYRPSKRQEVFEVFDMIGDKRYRFVAGNTGQGVYRIENNPEVFIDLNGLAELHGSEITSEGITLGANIGLTEAMNLFYKLAKEQPKRFSYCQTLADHIDLIANVPVRNTGTFAGNIAMKHEREEFPSDLFLFCEMAGAELLIADSSGEDTRMGFMEYLQTDMNKKLIVKIYLPNLDDNHYVTRSYKIMPRAQNAHAYVNAGFKVKVDKNNKFSVMEKPTLLFGGIEPSFLHAVKTEEYLTGKKLLDEITLKGALSVLESELKPDHILPDATPEFRIGLALSLFYKFILSLAPDQISAKYKSGGSLLQRPVSKGIQDFQTDSSIWPLNKPVPKIEALTQCAGEAEYTNDIPAIPGQVWGQLVLSERANALVSKIDPSEALKLPGVIAFFSAKDIPGKNSFIQSQSVNYLENERVFVDGRAKYAGEAVGVIIAESHTLAIKAAKLVKIEYTDQGKILIDMREIIDGGLQERIKEYAKLTPKDQGKDVKHTIKGTWDLKTQYHYTMETQTCIAVPTEDHLEVYPASQWPASAQEAISLVLNIPENAIDLRVRRLGGGYGAKISRANHIAATTALSAHLLHRPVRMVLNLETNMEWTGKRFPVYSNYEVGVDDNGVIQYFKGAIYQDDGYCPNDSSIGATIHHLRNVYNSSRWDITGYGVTTDSACNTWCRAPGSTEAIAFIETIMEHISNATGKDPISVRLANIDPSDPIVPLINDMRKNAEYDSRLKQIQDFNAQNRWKKRGIALVPMNYPFDFWGSFYGMVSIYGMDGSVAISHGAIEMGQGVNTKAAQVAAHILGVELESISVKPTISVVSPNNSSTGGSLGSEAICYAVKVCCEELNKRLQPIKEKLGSSACWKDVCNEAYKQNINLNYTYMFTSRDDVKSYAIYGVVVTEVEIDVLTGQYHTKRVDLMEDAGQSLSPEIDVGQVEGAFIMGTGYFTCEETVYKRETGQLLTNRTWNYKPPGAKDIPIDFRITLRKNAPNPTGVLRSKATGEPPLCLSCSIVMALRNAIESARKDSGKHDEVWFDLEPPCTGERIWLGCLTKKEMFKL